MRVCLILLWLLSAPLVLAQHWQVLAPLPQAVQEIYPAVHKGKIYVAGGLSDDIDMTRQQMTAKVQIYDPASGQWQFGPDLPTPRHHVYLVSVADKLFLFGGFVAASGGRWSATDEVLLLDEENARWQQVATLPRPLAETTAGVVGNRIHLASGRSPQGDSNAEWRDQHDVAWHWVFDPETYSLTESTPLPAAFNSAAAVVVDEQFYVLGGRQVGGSNLDSLYRFDATKKQWQLLPSMPLAQGGLAVSAHRQAIWVFGGEYFDNGGGVYADVWMYDIAAAQWRPQGQMPLPRHGLGAVHINDTLYIIGGATEAGLKATSDRLESLSF